MYFTCVGFISKHKCGKLKTVYLSVVNLYLNKFSQMEEEREMREKKRNFILMIMKSCMIYMIA